MPHSIRIQESMSHLPSGSLQTGEGVKIYILGSVTNWL